MYHINAKLSDGSTILKEDYNIEMKEKDNNIELNFNKKEESSDFFKDNFKVFFEKTNEKKYYVYFDENQKDKKEITEEDVKGTIADIRRSENYESDEKAEKINLHELQQKDNKDNSKEISEKKENNSNFLKYIFEFVGAGVFLYLFFKKDKNKKETEENTEITESKPKTTLKDFKENFLRNQNKWFRFVIERRI